MLRRDQGKLAFGSLQDSSGRIQLFAMAKSTPEFEGFTHLSIGDWIAVTGIVMMTRRGELSVRVDGWEVLASARRPFPINGTASLTPTRAIDSGSRPVGHGRGA